MSALRLATLGLETRSAAALVSGDRAAVLDEACAQAGERLDGVDEVIEVLRRWDQLAPILRRLSDRLPDLFDGGLEAHELTRLMAPIARPGKVIAIGRNYAEHAHELGNEVPAEPMIFTKHPTAVTGPFSPIPRPAFVTDLDYEAELAVVIGRGGRDIAEERALEHVAGYCCANDVSARSAQMATGQFVRGKSFDGFCPLGPWLVARDDIDDVQALRITCRVDGEIRQQSTTALMIFPVARLIAHCSAATTLEPGDVILTGTPPGVAMGRTPSPWLEPGQLCEVEIEGIGRLANPVTAG